MKCITLTGVSGSGKTTLQNELIEKYGWDKPVNWTSRTKRYDTELDEYVFVTKEQFVKKIENGDFLEHTMYNGNYYGQTGPLKEDKNYVIVLEPVGLAVYKKYFLQNNIKFTTFYLDIDEELQEERLGKRGDSCNEIRNRRKDFSYMKGFEYDHILDGRDSIDSNIEFILTTLTNNN